MERSPYPVAELPPAFTASPPPAGPAVRASALELPAAGTAAAEEASGVWDWGTLLDFTLEEDDPLIISWAQEDRLLPDPAPAPPVTPIPPPPPLQESSPASSIRARTAATAGTPSRVRKRDQRLTCENYLAGRVPCACPELDKMDEEEEEEAEAVGAGAGGGRKRVRVRVGGEAAIARCQVPGCGADIRELKGYHRRHRVCLRCANASSVFLDGESKRYCQQCGKFHILPDFDEGKRSCRRKLERHNKRRRRRLVDHKNIVEGEKESLGNLPADAAYDEEPTKANIELSNEIVCGVDSISVGNTAVDTETSLEPEDGEGSPGLSVPSVHTVQSNSVVSFSALHETQMEERVDNTKSTISSSFVGAHSSLCPTGRVSFKLYDWNPADFPRRLRHQIFQWLASMPVELEGYIRPGCTILTLFIAMPQFMWDKLSEESMVYVNDLVKAPESLLSGRGNILIYLNNKIFQVLKDGTLLANVQMEVQVPRLHYVHPNCFEAGKPMEFIACGSNLLRHKFRFLVSFAGRYLHNEFCGVVSHGVIKSCHEIGDDLLSSEHQMLMIRVNTEPDIFGPAFIEVENECGTSNFVPVLFGSLSVCTEMVKLRGSVGDAFCSDIISQTADSGAIPHLCKHLVSSQTLTSDLLLDIAWFLKEPTLDKNEMFSNSTHIQRLNCLLKHLLQNGSFSILEEVLHYFDASMKGKDLNELTSSVCDTDLVCFLNYVNDARKLLHQKGQLNGRCELDSEKSSDKGSYRHYSNLKPCAPCSMGSISKNGKAKTVTDKPAVIEHATKCCEEDVALLNKDVCHRTDCYPHLASEWQQEPWFRIRSRRITSTRLAVFIMVSVVMCCGICVALLHPHKAGDFVVMVRRSVWWIGQS